MLLKLRHIFIDVYNTCIADICVVIFRQPGEFVVPDDNHVPIDENSEQVQEDQVHTEHVQDDLVGEGIQESVEQENNIDQDHTENNIPAMMIDVENVAGNGNINGDV